MTQIQARSTLSIVGTGDGIDLMRALGTGFEETQKESAIKIPPSIGSGGGIGSVLSNQAVMGRVARSLKNEEVARGLQYVAIARIPTVFFLNKGVKVKELSATQISDIYLGKTRNWQELGGENQRIRIVRRENDDSSLGALRKSLPAWAKLEITERTKMATSTQEAIDTVHDVEGTIGFGPYSTKLTNAVHVLALDGVKPTQDNYPAFVELALIYTNETITPDYKKFLEFAKSKRAAEIIRQFGAQPAQN